MLTKNYFHSSNVLPENRDLLKTKLNFILQIQDKMKKGTSHFSKRYFLIHGLPVCFMGNEKLLKKILNPFKQYLYFSLRKTPILTIVLFGKEDFPSFPKNWDEEKNSEIHIPENGKIIQRDFITVQNGIEAWSLLNEDQPDGLHNLLRWALPGPLIMSNKILVHSSCVVNNQGRANLFLGPSGRGKTTIAKLALTHDLNFKILGDDMNVIHFDKNKVVVSGSGLGGALNLYPHFDECFPLDSIYFLEQATSFKLEQMTKARSLALFFTSCANLFIGKISKDIEQNLLNLGTQLTQQRSMFNLKFTKCKETWNELERYNQNIKA